MILASPLVDVCFERARSAIAVIEKLDVGNLIPLETRQQAEGRRDLFSGHGRFVDRRAEESDSVTLLNIIWDLEIERFPEALDRRKTPGSACGPLCVPVHGIISFQLRVVKIQ